MAKGNGSPARRPISFCLSLFLRVVGTGSGSWRAVLHDIERAYQPFAVLLYKMVGLVQSVGAGRIDDLIVALRVESDGPHFDRLGGGSIAVYSDRTVLQAL